MFAVTYEHPNTKRSMMMEKRILLRDSIVFIDLLRPRVDDNDVSLTKKDTTACGEVKKKRSVTVCKTVDVPVKSQTDTMHGMESWNRAESKRIGPDSLKAKHQVALQSTICTGSRVWYGLKTGTNTP